MTYDPFTRGPLPVGVRTLTLKDSERGGRALPTELWYPAADAHAGQDLQHDSRDTYQLMPGFPTNYQHAVRDAAPRKGAFPLVVFSHGFGAHRRQSTFLCTHLASHGYVVVGADHVGNTIAELMSMVQGAAAGTGEMPALYAEFPASLRERPPDISFLIDRVLAGAVPEVAASIDRERIGMTGHSFGGWTTLAATARDRRIRAALPLAPAGGDSGAEMDPFRRALALEWDREVPTLFLVADRDTLLPLDGMRELFGRVRPPKRMVVLTNTDHMHFVDQARQAHELYRALPRDDGLMRVVDRMPPFDDLAPAAQAHVAVRSLGLMHMDAHLKGDERARALLAGDLTTLLAERGVAVA